VGKQNLKGGYVVTKNMSKETATAEDSDDSFEKGLCLLRISALTEHRRDLAERVQTASECLLPVYADLDKAFLRAATEEAKYLISLR
jgi:hypothetical protein